MTINLRRTVTSLWTGALCLGLLASSAVLAQPTDIQPEATRLLKASTDFVARQQRFSLETRNSLEVVLTSGQKIQFDHRASQSVQRPNKLRADRMGDLVEQSFYYDGKTLTLLDTGTGAYATVTAPGTLEAMLDFAREKLGVVAPAGDLLFSNAYDILMTDVTSGFVVGKAVVAGVRCDHLAFRAPHVDWQIWIEEGARPLPRKFVITTRDVVNAPQFAVEVVKWDLAPKFTSQTFNFTAPKNGRKVDFLPAAAASKQ